MVDINDMNQEVDPSWVVILPGTVSWETHRRGAPKRGQEFHEHGRVSRKGRQIPMDPGISL